LLVNPNDVVFAAQVNQSTFGVKFASVTFDNITTGAITDVFDGFTVYVGDTTDIRKASFVGRARGDGSAGTTLNINETSAAFTDDQFITVVKDVAIREKLGRYVSKVMKVDWDITFRQLLPRVTGLKSAYVGILSGGQVDFTLPAVGKVTTAGASISSWSWDADGGSFVNGTVSTDAQPDIRYTTAGVYWPRVTVTDNGGRSNWFTMPVFVCSSDLSDSFIVDGLEGIAITANINNGYQMNLAYYSQEMESVADQTFVALWAVDDYNGSSTAILDEIAFIGRLRRATTGHSVDNQYGILPNTNFVCDGVLTQMGRLRSPQAAMIQDASPTEFGEIATMTQWRAASYILTEFSTVTNVSSVLFDVEDNTYRNRQDSTDDNSLLVSINNLLSGLNSRLNAAAQGELYAAHNANFQSDAARNALDTITTFTDNDTFSQRINREHVETTGRITAFAGGYNTTDGKLRVLRATAPAIASGEGQGTGTLNGILLDDDQSLDDQKSEIEQIAADALADRNPKDSVTIDILDGYWFVTPANFQWYGYIGAITENNRDIVYNASDRFLLTSFTLRFNNQLSSWDCQVALTHETQGTDAQVISQVAPGAIPTPLPAIPSLPAYPSFPALDSLYLPTGATEDDEPPVKQGDGEIIASPTDPFSSQNKGDGSETTETLTGNVGAIWNANNVWIADNLGQPGLPNWREVYNNSGTNIKDFKFVPSLDKAYVLENSGADDSNVFKTDNVRESIITWTSQSTTLDDLEATLLRPAGNTGVIMYGIAPQFSGGPTFTIDLLNSNGQGDLVGSSLVPTHSGTVSNFVGVYNSGNDRFDGGVGSNGGLACNIEWPIPPGVRITDVTFNVSWGNNWLGDTGERRCSIEIFLNGASNHRQDQDLPHGLAKPQAGSANVEIPGTISKSGDVLLLHAAVEDDITTYLRINSVQIKGTALADYSATRFSDDSGDTFDPLVAVGLMSLGDGSFDTRNALRVLASREVSVRRAATAGALYTTNADQGSTTPQWAKAIWLFGGGSDDNYLVALNSSVGLYKIWNNVRTNITPNDGANDGFALGPNSICMSQSSDEHAWFIGDFGGTTKLAYTSNLQDVTPTWTFSAQAFTAAAIHIRVKSTRTDVVMVAQNDTFHVSIDGGVSFSQKTIPATGIIGVEIK
jgi:hypothetical protein